MRDADRPRLPLDVAEVRGSLPRHLEPMQPRLAAAPFNSPEHIFEVKWDGVRALVARDEQGLRIADRHGLDLLARLPELAVIGRQLAPGTLLDGEVVVCDARGRPRYELLAGRLGPKRARRGRGPLLVAFDLLYEAYRPLLDRPLVERRERLARLPLGPGGRLIVPEHLESDGEPFFEAVVENELEGVVAKRRDGQYVPGARTGDWLRLHARPRLDGVVCGVTSAEALPVALLCGAYREGTLVPVGMAAVPAFLRAHVAERIRGLETRASSLEGPVNVPSGLRWLRPELCAMVEHRGGATLAADARFRSFRVDLRPEDCRVEEPLRVASAPRALAAERPRLVVLRSLFPN